MTTAMLAGAHRIEAKLKHVLGATHLIHNPLLDRLLAPLEAYLWSATALEAAIRYLARHYERRGQLSGETRRHFEQLVGELARAERG